jgi:ubiquinone/menaquinone biosynthesis C-methylase UbiE
MAKDNFSKQASTYAKFRPFYPKEVFEYLFSLVENKKMAWDCATGNGQMATELAMKFEQVMATDISENQLAHAPQIRNIKYLYCPAEKTPFADDSFDLISVGQAIHWFDFEDFYAEARRVAKNNGFLFVIGYSTPRFETKIDKIIQAFYKNITGPYWDDERKYIDAHYETIPFPFERIACPVFSMNYEWTIEMAEGYFNSWSAVQHFMAKNAYNPVNQLIEDLKPIWDMTEKVHFPLFTKVGLIEK